MNIVKLNNTCTNLDFRDKYCYVLHDHVGDRGYMYLVPVDKISQEQYIGTLRGEDIPGSIDTVLYRDEWVDKDKSPLYFSPYDYIKYNITDQSEVEAARMFRTNFAKCVYTTELINGRMFRSIADRVSFLNLTDNEESVFSYYAHDMQDEILSTLQRLDGQEDVVRKSSLYANISQTNSGCSCSSKAVSEYSILHSYCVLADEYKVRIRDLMVTVFTNLDFWKKLSGTGVASNMSSLVQKVLNAGFSIYDGSKSVDIDTPCEDACHRENLYADYRKILEDMVKVLDRVESGDFSMSSFMKATLSKFSTYYEYMQWSGTVVDANPTDFSVTGCNKDRVSGKYI